MSKVFKTRENIYFVAKTFNQFSGFGHYHPFEHTYLVEIEKLYLYCENYMHSTPVSISTCRTDYPKNRDGFTRLTTPCSCGRLLLEWE